jgi:hypothetical protein
MSRVQSTKIKKTTTVPKGAHLNHMGGASWDIHDPVHRLRIAASSCFFGEPTYYQGTADSKGKHRVVTPSQQSHLSAPALKHLRSTLVAIDPPEWRGLGPAELMETTIDEALAHDPRETLEVAAYLRNEMHIRTTPQIILVRASRHPKVRGTGLVRAFAKDIVKRADEPSVGLAYHVARYGKDAAIPNSLKRAWRDVLQGFNEYSLAKYRMESRGEKTVDVMNLVHPKSEAIDKLAKGTLKSTDQTWEAIISAEGSSRQSWEKALDVMGHMALLRNVRNLLSKGVPPELFTKKLIEGAKKGQQLPFRYWSAYNAIRDSGSTEVKDAIEEAMMASVGTLPKFQGRVMSLCDNSGSAHGAMTSAFGSVHVNQIANLSAILTGLCSDEGHIGIFGDRLETRPVGSDAPVLKQLDQANKLGQTIGGGTEHGIWLFWDRAIKQKQHWDHVFVYSDMQAGHGGLYGTGGYDDYVWSHGIQNQRMIDVPKLVRAYRESVNPKVNVYLVQVAGYQDTIIPEFYDRTYILGGWGEGILRFARFASELADSLESQSA